MRDYLLIEKSKFDVKSINESDKYTLEGVFTEFDNENRNGRVYTKKEFQPHFDSLKKVVESGTAVGELDHPKQFETTLKNVAHKIEDIWMDEQNNRVMGRIKLLDTDAGKQAKALVDAGIPLHISSRAAGTVTENKSVKIHKLFTYDLVDTPGFANARLNSVNESFGMLNESADLDEFSDFAIYEVGKQIKQDMTELNNKNKDSETMEYIKESEFNKYSDFTKEAIDSVKDDISEMKEIQESIIEQNDSIVDEYSNADFKSRLDGIDEKLTGISKWADHVKDEFEAITESKDEDKKVEEDEEDKKVEEGEDEDKKDEKVDENTELSTSEKLILMESKYAELEAKFEAMVKWSDHASKTVSAIEKWTDHVTESVTLVEESTETITKWSEHVTESVTKLEESEVTKVEDTNEKINENKVEDFKASIYSKLEGILENAKEQGASDNKSLNESESEKLDENESPLWLKMIPSKYKETWNGLDESEKVRITNRADLFDFKTESTIKDFWNNELTKENLIKEEKVEISKEDKQADLSERRQAAVASYRRLF